MNRELVAIYDRFADTYEENRGLFDMTAVLRDFRRHLPSAGWLLDLGCGAGEPFAKAFAASGWKVTGVDFSPHMLELAARYVPEMNTVLADMCEVDFPVGTFDAITAIYSVFHVARHDHPRLFANCFRWLKPGGCLLFTYATRDWTGADEFEGYKDFMGEQLFYSHTRPEQLQQLLQLCGFELLSAENRAIGGETFLWVTAKKR